MSTKEQDRLEKKILMKKGSYPRKNNGKNRELMVYNTIVRGKMLNAKVNVD